jgi:hypothetical protein
MTDYSALVAKWATLTGDTATKLAAVNAATVAGPNVPVPVLQVMTYLRTNNLWMGVKASQTPGAMAAVDYNSDPRVQTLDVSLLIVRGMLADLVTHTLLTQAQADAIVAMGTPPVPWWQANGYSRAFDLGDINAAGLV